jgi:hypothetical protein
MANAYQIQFNSPYSETYNPNWRNHPNFSWRNSPSTNEPQRPSSNVPYVPPHKKTFADTMQTFIQRQDQINQNTMQNIQELKNSVDRIEPQLNVREKGMFLAQPQTNPRTQGGVNEVKNIQVEHAKSVTVLKSGKIVNKEIPTKVSQPKENLETKDDDKPREVEDVEERLYKPIASFF